MRFSPRSATRHTIVGLLFTLVTCPGQPSPRRATRFFRGYDVFDPVRVGFVSSGPEAEQAGFEYDVMQPGNGNAGHEYGVALSPGEKQALVEFMKTL